MRVTVRAKGSRTHALSRASPREGYETERDHGQSRDRESRRAAVKSFTSVAEQAAVKRSNVVNPVDENT